MPFYQLEPIFPLIPSVIDDGTSRDFTQQDCSKYIAVANTAETTFTLTSSVTTDKDAEIIIRNTSESLDIVTIVKGAGIDNIDVSPVLGLVIPVGGIGQLKRIGLTNTWSFYGYIEA